MNNELFMQVCQFDYEGKVFTVVTENAPDGTYSAEIASTKGNLTRLSGYANMLDTINAAGHWIAAHCKSSRA